MLESKFIFIKQRILIQEISLGFRNVLSIFIRLS